MSAPQHSPLPWHIDPSYPLCIEAADGNVALMNLARANPADSALIVRAVNSHAALVAALKSCETDQDGNRLVQSFDEKLVSAALALAAGGKAP